MGEFVGLAVLGTLVGCADIVGSAVGLLEGCMDGNTLGFAVGITVGNADGTRLGAIDARIAEELLNMLNIGVTTALR